MMVYRGLIVSLCLFFSPAASLWGQTFQASALVGMNLSQIDGDDLIGFNLIGANAGLRVVAVLNDRWRIGPEILFSQQGARLAKSDIFANNFSEINFNTLEVPLMVYFKDWRFTAEAGVAYQRLISYSAAALDGADITETTFLQEDQFNFQTGVTFYLKPNWGFNFRWSKSIGNILLGEPEKVMKSRNLVLRLVYTLGDGEPIPKAVSE